MKALLGDYPVTRLFKAKSSLEFADVKVPNTAFKRVVRELEFDVAELALMTFLLAKAHGKPYRLLPAVVTARFQHSTLAYNPERGPLSPEKLAGKGVGMRSYSVTTATWVRGILADDYGVDLDKVNWVTFEEPHVAEFRDPPNATRMPAGKDVTAMLLAGRDRRRDPRRAAEGRAAPAPDTRSGRRGRGVEGEEPGDPDQPHGHGEEHGVARASDEDLRPARGSRRPPATPR